MSNKTALWIIAGVVILIAGIMYLMSRPMDTESLNKGVNGNYDSAGTAENENMEARGKAVFSVTDAAADMGEVTEIKIVISGLEAHNTANGWVTIATAPRTYSLLDLDKRNESELLAETDLQTGTYDQIRLNVDSVTVKTKNGETSEAKLPSQELKLNTKIVVSADETSSVNFDFLAAKSLHTTGSGEYVYAPVVKTETRSNSEVTIASNGVVKITGGDVDDESTIGMDVDGSLKANFEIKSGTKLDIGTDNKIKLGL
jgi:hypothetical protein